MFAELLLAVLLISAGPITVEGIYPNPTTPEDRGEFVLLDVPANATTAGLALTDGEDTIPLAGLEKSGLVAVALDPGPAAALTDANIYRTDSFLALSNAGEQIRLIRAAGSTSVRFPDAPEGELYRNGSFEPPARSSFDPLDSRNVTVRATVLPDRPGPLQSPFETAENRILLAGYTITDPAVTAALIAAHRRNVTVRVLIEGGPVGGMPETEVDQLLRLRAAGIPVSVMGTDHARYRYQHAKYAVVDGRAVVTSENWEPGGTGGHGSRGWAVVLEDPRVAADLSRIFRVDTGFIDTPPWTVNRSIDTVAADLDTRHYSSRFGSLTARAERVTVFAAPDNAGPAVAAMLANATTSIRVQQVSIQRPGRLLNATLAAAERGVRVRILVSGAWYVERENRAFAAAIRARAVNDSLPIEVRVAEPRSRYEKIHNKGVIVDGETVLVGSLNWNANARTENREIAVRIDDPAVATYFGRVFRADWRGAAWRVPWGLLAVAGLVVALGVRYAASIAAFEPTDSRSY
ncbi:MAG: phosphatidylserine/phosphatidylglycerophosphate/cardiolipin synthase family protein [Halodesulfurarchaeum sp.]